MSNYEIGIAGTVPPVCWIKAVNSTDYEVFCNVSGGYEVIAKTESGDERVVESGDGPTHKTVALDLRAQEVSVTIRAK